MKQQILDRLRDNLKRLEDLGLMDHIVSDEIAKLKAEIEWLEEVEDGAFTCEVCKASLNAGDDFYLDAEGTAWCKKHGPLED